MGQISIDLSRGYFATCCVTYRFELAFWTKPISATCSFILLLNYGHEKEAKTQTGEEYMNRTWGWREAEKQRNTVYGFG